MFNGDEVSVLQDEKSTGKNGGGVAQQRKFT